MGLFLTLLLIGSIILGVFNGFVGLILFIVYIGGTMVLFTYCFMLSPRQTFGSYSKLYPLAAVGLGGDFPWVAGCSVYEFYRVSDRLMCVGVLFIYCHVERSRISRLFTRIYTSYLM